MKYEYKTITTHPILAPNMDELNRDGQDGWQVVFVIPHEAPGEKPRVTLLLQRTSN